MHHQQQTTTLFYTLQHSSLRLWWACFLLLLLRPTYVNAICVLCTYITVTVSQGHFSTFVQASILQSVSIYRGLVPSSERMEGRAGDRGQDASSDIPSPNSVSLMFASLL